MSRLGKIIGWLLAGIIALFVLGAVAFILFFDANDFRDEISGAVEDATGRELTIEGEIGLSFFPWLAVDVGRTSLGNAAGFGDEPFARFERARMGVRLLPLLLRRQVVTSGVDVDGFELYLEENRQGVSNWGDLFADREGEEGTGEEAGDSDIDAAGVSFSNATVSYHDARSGTRYVLREADMRVGPVTGKGKTIAVDGFSLRGELEGVGAMPSRLAFSTDEITVQTGEQTVALAPLELEALGLDIRADVQPFSYATDVQPKAKISVAAFSPRSLMTLFGTEPPETADPVALSRVIIDATAALTAAAIELTDVDLKLDDTTLRGSLSVPRASTGTYRFDLDADRIELARYMAPAGDPAEAAKSEAVPVKIPAELIRPLKARGNLRIGSATLGNIAFENVVLGLNAANGNLRLNPVSAKLFGGTYSGDVRVNAAGKMPELTVDEKIEGVDLGKLAGAMFGRQNITGGISGAFRLSGRGDDMDAVQRSLAGNMSFKLDDGAYEGTDIWYELRRARALLKRETPPQPTKPPRTRFSTVTATGVVKDGVMRNDDLFAELPFMQLRGKGNVDLAAATLDYGLTARVLERPESLAGASEAELNDFTEAVIPLKITGPLSAPSVSPDVGSLVRQRVKEEVKERLVDKLLGGKKEPETPAADAPAEGEAPAGEAPQEEKSVEDEVKDELKKKLKGLFD